MILKVGDRIIINDSGHTPAKFVGKEGTIVRLNKSSYLIYSCTLNDFGVSSFGFYKNEVMLLPSLYRVYRRKT